MVILIGLTGNIACGKSTVARHWQRNGCLVLDTDKMAADAVAPGTPGFHQILEAFAEHRDRLLAGNGSLNRRYLGQIVFNDTTKKRKLEAIVWPKVYRQLLVGVVGALIRSLWRTDVVVIEVPQLFEAGSFTRRLFDATVVVCCNSPEQLHRLMIRNADLPEEDAKTRLGAQMPQSEKQRLATHVIDNSGQVADTIKQADAVLDVVKQNYAKARMRKAIFLVASASCVLMTVLLFYHQ